jgi:hypothetical protein
LNLHRPVMKEATPMPSNVPVTPEAGDGTAPRLALRPREAARALGIGVRLLWSKTNCGEIPCVKIGKRTVYPISLLEDYLRKCATGGAK